LTIRVGVPYAYAYNSHSTLCYIVDCGLVADVLMREIIRAWNVAWNRAPRGRGR